MIIIKTVITIFAALLVIMYAVLTVATMHIERDEKKRLKKNEDGEGKDGHQY